MVDEFLHVCQDIFMISSKNVTFYYPVSTTQSRTNKVLAVFPKICQGITHRYSWKRNATPTQISRRSQHHETELERVFHCVPFIKVKTRIFIAELDLEKIIFD